MRIEPINLQEARAAVAEKVRRQQREAFRLRMGYDVAKTGRLTFDWAFKHLSFDQVVREAGLVKIRERCRELARNDDNVIRFLALLGKNVIGPDGIVLQSKVKMQRGGRPAKDINDEIEAAWKDWSKNCTTLQRFCWQEVLRLTIRGLATDGEVFFRKRAMERDLPHWFALQPIDTDCVDETMFTQLPDGSQVRFGIETDPSGIVVAYHIWNKHPSEASSGPRLRYRVPASEIIHIFRADSFFQTRGIPWIAPAAYECNMLKSYKEAEVTAARIAACQMGLIQKDLQPDQNYPEDESVEDTDGARSLELTPGQFEFLKAGETMTQFKPEHPVTAFDSFMKAATRSIAAGLDVAYMSLSGDLEAANYSSARVGLLDERATYQELQWWIIGKLVTPVYDVWLENALYSSLADLPYGDPAAINFPEWHPQSFAWVDPLKDAQAEVIRLENGFTTRHRVLAAQGQDYDETMRELAEEKAAEQALGLELGSKPGTNAATASLASEPPTPPAKPKGPQAKHRVNGEIDLTDVRGLRQ